MFLQVKVEGSQNISCPACGSLERHRLLGAWFESSGQKSIGSVLHIAPERCIEVLVKRLKVLSYLSIDFQPGRAERVEDLRSLSFLSSDFDEVICFHVLEHISEDEIAMREINRVLKSGGRAWISVPLIGETTLEAQPNMTSLERKQKFGQVDHVRNYGRDIRDRLASSGLEVRFVSAQDFLNEGEIKKLGLNNQEVLIISTKP
jgi:SAM-dependent methyltransferase